MEQQQTLLTSLIYISQHVFLWVLLPSEIRYYQCHAVRKDTAKMTTTTTTLFALLSLVLMNIFNALLIVLVISNIGRPATPVVTQVFEVLSYDDALTWRIENPDLTFCFQRTILQWVPCFFLYVFTIYEVFRIASSRYRDIPWNWYNVSKKIICLALMILSWIELGMVVSYRHQEDVFDVQILVAIFNAIAYIIAIILYYFFRKFGIQSSGTIFIFWFLKMFFGIIQMRTEANLHSERTGDIESSETIVFAEYQFVNYTLQYALICLMLLMEVIPDQAPRYSDFPKQKNPNPELRSSFVVRLLYLYFDSFTWRGFRKPLTDNDMYDLNPEDTSRELIPPFDKYWNESVEKGRHKQMAADKKAGKTKCSYKPHAATNGSTLPAMVKAYGGPFWFAGLLQLAISGLQFASPYLMRELMMVIATNGPFWKGMIITFALFLTSFLIALFNGQYFRKTFLVGFRIRTGLVSAIYRKALRISSFAKKDTTVGEIVNLMAVDAQRFFELTSYLHILWSAPIIIALCIYLLYEILGPAVFAGLGVMVILIPVTGVIANKMKDLQVEQMKIKDERVKKMNEILSGIKVLKLYAWEPSFQRDIVEVRSDEISILRVMAYYGAATFFVWSLAPFLVTLASFTVYVLIDENNVLDPQTAFVSLALFNILRFPLAMFPMMITFAMQAWVSVVRINKFMNSEEMDPNNVTHEKSENAVAIRDGTFSWGDEAATLKNINLTLRKGQLVAVVGSVGTGKSSLISALLGEMEKIRGSVNTDGKIAFVPQQAWIQNATLRDNILFGKQFDERKYDKVLECCALKPDLEMLPGGDLTEIGEKGINLSGGQKQRVALARAVYADADIYLFDDPLSAVDAHVGKHIFEKVVGPQGLLVGRSRLLVTHGISFLPHVGEILVIKDGEISESGSYQQLLDQKGAFAEFLTQHIQNLDDEDEEIKMIQEALDDEVSRNILKRAMSIRSNKSGGSNGSARNRKKMSRQESRNSQHIQPVPVKGTTLIEKEQSATGSVDFAVYMKYFRAIGWNLAFWSVLFTILNQASAIYSNIWLTDWSEDPSAATDSATRDMYLGIYGGLGGVQSISLLIASITLAIGCLKAANTLHNNLLESTLRMPMSFFDTTPQGRIMNRFSKDVDVADNTLPQSIRMWLLMFVNVVGVFIVIAISTPIFLAVVPVFLVIYYAVQKFYIATSRQLKRLESVTRSPIYSHFGESITGQSTIRAYGQQDRFTQESEKRVDYNQLMSYPSIIANRWLAIRLETVGALVVFFAALFAMISRDSIGAAMVGLSITYALQISAVLNFLVRMTAEVETNIVAVERLDEYTVLPREAEWEKGTVDKAWPVEGKVNFNDYKIRYREGLDLVIRGISLNVKGGEKIGIVGRTGAGKSSLTLGLFRIVESAGGSITIDGLDISQIGLHQLRSRLTIIPQDPVLFSGNLRLNIDPFKSYTDDQVWQALELSHLKSFVKGLQAGLDHEIAENGENLSVGQRQLICLARAILRKTKVLILDEATAAVDLETDDLIQKTIRTEFADCTILTIAHRLNTIMDSDRVLVLDKGLVAECDTPQNLLSDKTTIFYGMAKNAGIVS
ncbi:multidrug resistance-associated protein 1-like isoform X2 [Toxorhynchites rutilus septentrionalis]|uniref:multidrug resistance-associated protein 1-like isoform X2 n=1 Tax=Toxorhynchites rutilus septentrionalis TaxID=329112 RepID=UPI00247AD579|nr:multidrug resistance-associated protein 1-like isoform X2 [Toxorhynchites rutilus septentrionalis]